MSQPIQPISRDERIDAIDIVRGFALLGILAVNMGAFSFPFASSLTGTPRGDSALDRVAEFAITWLATGKFYPLFSFLFGFGMALQIARVESSGGNPVTFMLRRLLTLLAFGLVHALLIWNGDILFVYALTGLMLLLFRNASPRALLGWAIGLLAFQVVFGLLGAGLTALGEAAQAAAANPFLEVTRELERRAFEVYARGSWGEIFLFRALEWMVFLTASLSTSWVQLIALFLFGMYFARREIFQQLDAHVRLFRAGLLIGLGVGLPANFALAWMRHLSDSAVNASSAALQGTLLQVFGPLLGFGYLSGFVLLARRAETKRLLAPLAAAGRMALTNYIAQSVICTLIFYSYGLGLFGKVGAFAGLLLTLAIWLAQLPLSVAWLSRFRFGLLEWLWRTLTYGRLQEMAKPALT
ncbi:MAG: DUF418 domain-containing protein [Anaerolineae bacterium]|nr:DUF418 domain-containing protein [Anaerolineae bacterium]